MKKDAKQYKLYTLGIWKTKSGKEQTFIEEWTSFARWSSENIAGAGKAYLLQDEKDASRFISFGPWESEQVIQRWRESAPFKEFVGRIKLICEDFQPNTLRAVSEAG